MVRHITNKNGVTLVESVITLVIVAIIGATIAGAVIFFVQLFMYSPRQLDTQKIGQEIAQTIIEGTSNARGIRYARNILDASSTQVSYTYGYPTNDERIAVRFRWDSATKHFHRSLSSDGGATWSAESLFPYYISNATTIDGKDTASVIFTYKKANDANWVSGTDAPSTIRRVIISINLKTGGGSFSSFEGSKNFTCSAEIKGFS